MACSKYNIFISAPTAPIVVVGFPVIESAVDESISTKYTCLQIFSGGPLLSDASIQFYTLDGSAKGEGLTV